MLQSTHTWSNLLQFNSIQYIPILWSLIQNAKMKEILGSWRQDKHIWDVHKIPLKWLPQSWKGSLIKKKKKTQMEHFCWVLWPKIRVPHGETMQREHGRANAKGETTKLGRKSARGCCATWHWVAVPRVVCRLFCLAARVLSGGVFFLAARVSSYGEKPYFSDPI